jgi:hypothetical protein
MSKIDDFRAYRRMEKIIKEKEMAEMTTMNPDKTTHVNNFVDTLFKYYAAKWLDQDQAPIYKDSLMGVYSLLEASEINEIQQKVFHNFQYIPKIHELAKLGNHYAKRHRKITTETPKQDRKETINQYNYKEEDFTKAVDFIKQTLEMVYTPESTKCFLDVHDMMVRGFDQSDLDFFANRLINAKKVPESYDLINMLIYIKKARVTPRVDKLRGRESTPQDMSPLDRQKYARMNRLLLNKEAPQLERK